jgi:hypothetical protein
MGKWSKLKYPRKVKARITSDLLRSINGGLKTIIAQNCATWMEHAGYVVQSVSQIKPL